MGALALGVRPETMGAREVLLALCLCLGTARALYFHIAETEQKCFIEEVPAETMIVGV